MCVRMYSRSNIIVLVYTSTRILLILVIYRHMVKLALLGPR